MRRCDLQHRRNGFEDEFLPSSAPIQDVPPDVHVWEERDILRDVADMPLVARQIGGPAGKKHPRANRDAPRRRRSQSGNCVEHRRLAGAGWSEECGDPGLDALADLEDEVALPQDEVECDHARIPARLDR